MAPSTPVRIVDSEGRPITTGNPLAVDATIDVDNIDIDLAGVSTEAKQDTIIAELQSLTDAVDGTEVQVDVVSLPLATDAATESKQDAAIAHLAVLAGVFGRTYQDATDEIDSGDSGSKILVAAPGVGQKVCLASLTVANTGTDGDITVKFGTTERLTFAVAQGESLSVDLPPFRELEGGDNEALVVDVSEDGPWHYWVQWREAAV